MKTFDVSELIKLYKPAWDSEGEDNGSVTIVGGSSLFHGAPILALKTASRVVDMVFFASPEPSLSAVVSKLKASLSSFIWVPWKEVEAYIEKSDATLIGPGFMRYARELNIKNNELRDGSYDEEGNMTREITKRLLKKHPTKKWVIDAGSLQTMEPDWIPEKAIITPNAKEYQMLFGSKTQGVKSSMYENHSASYMLHATSTAKKYNCIIVAKGPETVVCSPEECVSIKGGNPGLTKGGSGDVLAGLTVALLAKNDPFLAACAASYIIKTVADELYKKVGVNYNSDDLADAISHTLHKLVN